MSLKFRLYSPLQPEAERIVGQFAVQQKRLRLVGHLMRFISVSESRFVADSVVYLF